MEYRDDVLNTIGEINRLWEKPQCYLVALLLASKHKGEIYYNSNHCITLIGNIFYDKDGIATPSCNYLNLNEFGMDIKKTLIDALVEKHQL